LAILSGLQKGAWMRRGGGKEKGARNERRLCRELSLLVSDGERDDLLWRSAMSGGRATVGRLRGKRRAAQAGDVSSIDHLSHWLVRDWYIEAKHYHDLQILRGFLFNSGRLHRFWRHTVKEAEHYLKRPMLIAKQDRQPELLIIPKGERLSKITRMPIISLPAWGADIYLFAGVEQTPVTHRARVLLEEEHVHRVLLEE
jgi:hypothetical protein